jgi:hypothetical protein
MRAWALLFWAAAASAQETVPLPPVAMTPATDQELVTLVRAQRLQNWLQQPVPLAISLCIQDRYRSRWPATDDAPPTAHQENALRMIHEACRAAAEENPSQMRFVTAGKAQFLERLARLRAVSRALDNCNPPTAPTAQVDGCVQSVAGRPLTAQERRLLLGEKDPSSPN